MWLGKAQSVAGLSWGLESRERRWSPSLPAPSTHTRTFLPCTAVELEAMGTLWKSEFHSLLAESSFLLGEGVHVCVHTTMETGRRGRHVGGGCLTR